MNIEITRNIIRREPPGPKNKYIFVNDNRSICEAIITVGFYSLYIARSSDSFFTVNSFRSFIRDIANTGTDIMKYTFVLSCYRKKTNDELKDVLQANMIPHLEGAYTLFRDKEYLANYEKQDELENALDSYIKRFEGGDIGIVDKNQFCRLDADGKVKGIHDYKIVQFLKETICMFVIGEDLYVYRDGVYIMDDNGIYIKSVIQELIPENLVTYRNLNAVYHLLLEQQELQKSPEEINQYPPWWINFRNGMYDAKEKKLRPHRPEYLSVNQIPHDLDFSIRENLDDAGKNTEAFFRMAIPDEADRIMLWQYIGYCMTRDTSLQKFLIIRGIGGTGKSRIISLVQEIVGSSNYSNIALQDLNQKFYPALMFGKLVNACADISSEAMESVDNIKKATGEDIMIYERKGKDARSFKSYARLIFSANKIPLNLDEKSNALYRRMLILQMNVLPEHPDRDLDQKLKEEIGYSIWMAVAALDFVYQNGRISESRNSREQVEELHRAADTVKAFMDEMTVVQPGEKILRNDLYEKYQEYCKNCGRKEHSPNPFYKNLEEKGYRFKRTASGRYILDVSFKEEGFLPDDDGEGSRTFRY